MALSSGQPHAGSLPTSEISDAFARTASSLSLSPSPLNYGENAGDGLLPVLADWISSECASDELPPNTSAASNLCRPENLFITSGVSHSIELVVRSLSKPPSTWERKPIVGMERPSYFLASKIFRSNNQKVIGLPMKITDDGRSSIIDLIALEAVNPKPDFIYVITSHQNPTGSSYPLEEKMLLLDFAERHDIMIIADEVYHSLDYRSCSNYSQTDVPPRRSARMSAFHSDNAISVSSFTKIFSPGVRVGWIEATEKVISQVDQYGYIVSQGGVAPLMGEIMKNVILSGGLDDQLSNLKEDYKNRVTIISSKIDASPEIEIVFRPLGGYFLWIRFLHLKDDDDFEKFCSELKESEGVTVLPSFRCDDNDDAFESTAANLLLKNTARICFAR